MSRTPASAPLAGGPAGQPRAVGAGHGMVYLAAAKLYFIIAGAAIEFILPRLLGAAGFGGYRVVSAHVSTFNNVVVTGTIQAVSRESNVPGADVAVVKATGLKLHLLVGLSLAILFALASPLFAHFQHDQSKTGPLALSAAILAGYAFYSVLVGAANGGREFHKQAGLDISFATLRASGILGAAALGLGIYGAIGGWVAAVGVILAIAAAWVGLPRTRAGSIRPLLRFFLGVCAYLLILNLLMAVDVILLKRVFAGAYQALGNTVAAAAQLADRDVGYYAAALNLARLPYQLLVAVTFVIFPLISGSTFDEDIERTRGYVHTTLRYSLVAAAGAAAIFAANPGSLLDVPYPPEYTVAAPALAALAPGYVGFTLFAIAGTILNAAGRTRAAILCGLVTLAAAAGGLWLVVPGFGPGPDGMTAAAIIMAVAMGIGALTAILALWLRFRAGLPILTLVRVALAVAAVVGVARLLPARSLTATVGQAILLGGVYLGTLIVSRELGRRDLALVTGALRRRRG